MNQNKDETTPKALAPPHNEEELRQLLRDAGPREAIPAGGHARIKAEVRSAWEEMVVGPQAPVRRPVRWRAVAVAATLVVAVLAGWFATRDRVAPVPRQIATVELESGAEAVGFMDEESDGTFDVTVGDDLPAGVRLATSGGAGEPAGRLALRMAGGESVRLDARTRVRLASVSRLELLQGAVYVDSDPELRSDSPLEIVTPLGVVRHVGTQYEVRLDAISSTVRVRVREGNVSVRNNGDSWAARRGEELTLQTDGSVKRASVDVVGDEWMWTVAAAPVLDIEGMPLDAFLRWIARETGWSLQYEDPELERFAAEVLLHGGIEGLRPDQAVGVYVEGSGLAHRIEDGVLHLTRP